MDVQKWRSEDCDSLANPGVQSRQLVWERNSPDSLVTITRVTMEPGAASQRHSHQRSEQIWIIEQGEGVLLLAEKTETLRAGDIVRTPAGAVHGISNNATRPLVYLAVTAPPQNFSYAYEATTLAGGE